MEPDPRDRPYPDAAEFVAHVASLHGLRGIVAVGLSWTPELAVVFPKLRVAGPSVSVGLDATTRAILVGGPASRLCGAEGSLSTLLDLATAPVVVVATDDAGAVLSQLAGIGLQPEFVGRTRAHSEDAERSGHLIVVDHRLAQTQVEPLEAPSDFRVVAIMSVYNEEDIIGPSIQKLIDDGVGVYVIDNWSTDRTNEIVRGFEGRGLVGLERFPQAPSERFVARALLRRVADVAAGLDANWCIHHDADERRCGPWPGLGLRESLWRVDRAGFSAVDHTVLNYRPIDNSFEPGGDFERHFRHFEFGRTSDLLLQIKAWKNVGRVDLASSAGHQAAFRGRRVFPYKFLLRHYPIRSQSHGERKIFRDRVPRWDRHERVRGWHVHYNDVAPGQSFLRDPGELIEDRGAETRTLYLPEMLTGAGIARHDLPDWALAGAPGRGVYLRKQAIERSKAFRLLRNVVDKPRGLARRFRSVPGRGR